MEPITKKCSFCDGSGNAGTTQEPGTCHKCVGTGKETLAEIDLADITDKLNDILDKCNDIFKRVKG